MFFFFDNTGQGGPSTFAERLRIAREAAGMSGKELSEIVGIRYNAYMSYENQGKEPRQETLIKIAAALNVSIDELLGVSSRQESPGDDIEKPLAHLQEMLQEPTANFRGKDFDHRGRQELSARVNELAQRAEVLSEFEDLGPDDNE